MSQIKYKYKERSNSYNVHESRFFRNAQNQKQMITSPQGLNEKQANSITREPQVIIINQNQPNYQQGLEISQSFRISRVKSYQEKPTSLSKDQISILHQQSSRINVNENMRLSVNDIIRQKSYYRTNSSHKIFDQSGNHSKSNMIQRIIDFRTKTFKVTTKKAKSPRKREIIASKDKNEPSSVSQKINNLRNIAVMNIQQDFDEISTFNKFNCLILKTKDHPPTKNIPPLDQSRSKEIISLIDEVKQYSNNEIYRQIRKEYKKDDQEQPIFTHTKNERGSLSAIKGIAFKNSLILTKRQQTPTKVIFNIKQMAKNTTSIKRISDDRLDGW